MSRHARRARRLAVIGAYLGSGAVGLAIVWAFVPGSFRELSTLELAGVVGLLVGPTAAAWVVMADRRTCAARAKPGAKDEPVDAEGDAVGG